MSNLYHVTLEAHGTPEPEGDLIPFSAGNPSVEHITGILHLYKPIETDDTEQELAPTDATDQVCVLAVPGDMGFKDFCQFLGSYPDSIQSMWMVRREGTPANGVCMALLKFKVKETAGTFVLDYNGKPFCMLEPDIICRCVLVAEVEMLSGLPGSSGPAAESSATAAEVVSGRRRPTPPAGHAELPTCPVCLERLDEHISGVITTVCNHKFHNECLQKWGDASCPVCRYCIHGSSTSKCDVCEASVDLWICLICGHVGCGRYREAHARQHFQDSHHCYSLEVESGRVWDYVGDGYVHRLIQGNVDGKLIEVSSPGPANRSQGPGRMAGESVTCNGSGTEKNAASNSSHGDRNFGSASTRDDLNMMEATYASKMDSIAREYNHLLTSQLESQRQYFEEIQAQAAQEHATVLQEAELKTTQQQAAAEAASKRAQIAEGNIKNCQKRLKDTEGKLRAATKEMETLSALNKSLIENQKVRKSTCDSQEAELTDLREQVRDLMVYIEAVQMVSKGGGEMSGGSVTVADAPKKGNRRSKK